MKHNANNSCLEGQIDKWTLAFWVRQDYKIETGMQYPFSFSSKIGVIDDIAIGLDNNNKLWTWLQFAVTDKGFHCPVL